jgi:hypothetical protein
VSQLLALNEDDARDQDIPLALAIHLADEQLYEAACDRYSGRLL